MLWWLCRRPHAGLSGAGGRLYSGRWHRAGTPVIYTAAEPSLAVLELRVNLDLPFELLPEDPREFGNAWLRGRQSALLSVPSVVMPPARHMLINPAHEAGRGGRSVGVAAFAFDARPSR